MKPVENEFQKITNLSKEQEKQFKKTNQEAAKLNDSFVKGSNGAKRLDRELKKQPKTLAEMELKLERLKELLRDDTRIGTEGFKKVKQAIDETEKSIDKANGKLDDTKGKGNQIISTFKKVGAALGIAFGVQQISQFIQQSIQLSARGEGIRRAFDKLNDPNLLSNLREATRGTVTDLELMRQAVRAENFQVPLERLGDFFEFATKRSIETGESVDYLVSSIVDGIGRKSTLVLDNLGISASELQDEIKRTGDFGEAAANIISRSLAETGEVADTTATQIARLNAEWLNFQESAGNVFSRIAVNVADAVGVINKNQGAIDRFRKSIESLDDVGLADKLNDVLAERERITKRQLELSKQENQLAKDIIPLKGREREEALKLRELIFQEQEAARNRLINQNDFIIVLKEEQRIRGQIADAVGGVDNDFYTPDQIDRMLQANQEQEKNIRTLKSLNEELKAYQEDLELAEIGSEDFTKALENMRAKEVEIAEVTKLLVGENGSMGLLRFELDQLEQELQRAEAGGADFFRILDKVTNKTKELAKATALTKLAEALEVDTEGDFSFDFEAASRELSMLVDEYVGETERATSIADDLWTAHFNELMRKQDESFANQKKQVELSKQIFQQVVSEFSSIASSIATIQQNRFKQETLELEEALKNREITQEEFDRKQKEIQAKSAQAAKDAALFQAIIGTAQAVVNALATPGVPFPVAAGFAALAAASGAVQIAAIASEPVPQFAEGVIDLKGKGTSKSDSIDAKLSVGESVMTAEETKEHKGALKAIRQKKFDDYVVDYFLSKSLGLRKDLEPARRTERFDYDKLAQSMANYIMFKDANLVRAIDKDRRSTADGLNNVVRAITTRPNRRTRW